MCGEWKVCRHIAPYFQSYRSAGAGDGERLLWIYKYTSVYCMLCMYNVRRTCIVDYTAKLRSMRFVSMKSQGVGASKWNVYVRMDSHHTRICTHALPRSICSVFCNGSQLYIRTCTSIGRTISILQANRKRRRAHGPDKTMANCLIHTLLERIQWQETEHWCRHTLTLSHMARRRRQHAGISIIVHGKFAGHCCVE